MAEAEGVGATECHWYVDEVDEVVRRLMEMVFMEPGISYELAEVTWRPGPPPNEPNAYSDADADHPKLPWLAHAGVGILFKDAPDRADDLPRCQPWGSPAGTAAVPPWLSRRTASGSTPCGWSSRRGSRRYRTRALYTWRRTASA